MLTQENVSLVQVAATTSAETDWEKKKKDTSSGATERLSECQSIRKDMSTSYSKVRGVVARRSNSCVVLKNREGPRRV